MATLTSSQKKSLEKAKQTLQKMSNDLKAGKVTGLTPSKTTTPAKTSTGGGSTPKVSTPAVTTPKATNGSYSVKAGDTLGAIAKANGMTVDALAKANNITNPNLIKVGQKLNVGTSAPVSSYDVVDYRKKVADLTSPSNSGTTWGLKLNTGYTMPNLGYANSTPSYVAPKTTVPPVSTPTISKPVAPTTPATPPTSTPNAGKVVWGIPEPTYKMPNMNTANSTPAYVPPTVKPKVAGAGQGTGGGGGGSWGTPTSPTAPTTPTTPTTTPEGGGGFWDTLKKGIASSSPASVIQAFGAKVPEGTPATTTPPATIQDALNLPPEQQLGFDLNTLAQLAGEVGLSVNEYVALMKSRTEPTKEETDAIAKELGIDTLETDVFKKPKETTDQIYQQEYKRLGLDDLKRKIEALDNDIAKDRQNLTEAVGTIDENPFLTETSRVGRGKRVLDQAEQTINNKIEQRKAYADLYDQSISEINALIKRTTDDFNVSQSVDQAKLNYLIKKAELQATQKQNTKTSGSVGTYLKGRQKLQDEKAPDLVGTSDTGYYRWDGATKKYVQVIAPAPKKSSSSDDPSVFKPTADQKANVGRFLSTAEGKALGLTPAEQDEAMRDSISFYALLQMASENGIY